MMANTWFAKSALNSRAGCNTGHICLQFSHGILCLYCNPIFGSWFTTGNRVLGIKMLNQMFEREREERWAIVCLWPISILTLLLSHCGYIYRYVTARGVNLEQNIMKSKHTLTSIETILIFPQDISVSTFPKSLHYPHEIKFVGNASDRKWRWNVLSYQAHTNTKRSLVTWSFLLGPRTPFPLPTTPHSYPNPLPPRHTQLHFKDQRNTRASFNEIINSIRSQLSYIWLLSMLLLLP